jgi:hypothetical protein
MRLTFSAHSFICPNKTLKPPIQRGIQMSDQSVVGIYQSMDQAEQAVRMLDQGGFPIKQVSIVAKNIQSEKKISGFVTTGDVAKSGAGIGAWTGGIFGLLVGAAFLWVPGAGPIIVAGPLAAALLGGIEGAAAAGATGGLLGAMVGWGVSKQHILKYEQSVNAGKYVLVCHGSAEEVRKANNILRATQPGELQVYAESAVAVPV